ncbi:hypothetical protein [Vibrio sp. Hal054]|uniref:hypothetical protein n=1 Tax=Vibrio sp. Hal054 TaxID=3035158 RepID=UPI00301BC79D
MDEFNLEFHRCPSAMTRTRKMLALFNASDKREVKIVSIEPALQDHIAAVLNAEYPNMSLSLEQAISIPERVMSHWQASPLFDEDDLENAPNQITLRVQKCG